MRHHSSVQISLRGRPNFRCARFLRPIFQLFLEEISPWVRIKLKLVTPLIVACVGEKWSLCFSTCASRADKVGDVYGLFRRHKTDPRQAVETCTNPNLRRPDLVQVKHTQKRSCLCDSKSPSLIAPALVRKMFWGLISRCKIFFPWRYSTAPRVICTNLKEHETPSHHDVVQTPHLRNSGWFPVVTTFQRKFEH